MRAALVLLCLIGGLACAAQAEGPLAPGDWRYDSLDRLSQAGLLSGHPQGPLGNWAANLTRFEAASLTLRAVQAVGEAYEAQGRSFVEIAKATAEEIPPPVDEPDAAVQVEEPPSLDAIQGLTAENLAVLQKLVEEFRTELVEMGARVEYVETGLKDVQSRLGKAESELKKHRISGYMQVRWRDDNATKGKQEFLVRRTRVNVAGPVTERAAYRIEFQLDSKEEGLGPGSKVQTRTAYIDYSLGKGLVRFGQHVVPWGYELLDSVPNLWTGERALFMDRLFPDQRDIGVLYEYRKSPTSPQFDVGVYNGTSINASDNNDRKNVMARVDFPVRHGTVALSGYAGESGVGDAATDQDRYGASARFAWPGGTEFLGEYVTGQNAGSDVKGWYAQVGHPVTGKAPNLLFAKYDQFDENTDTPDDQFRRWSLGYWYQLDAATRLTLVHELRRVGPAFSELTKWDGNATYLQLQLKF